MFIKNVIDKFCSKNATILKFFPAVGDNWNLRKKDHCMRKMQSFWFYINTLMATFLSLAFQSTVYFAFFIMQQKQEETAHSLLWNTKHDSKK